MNQQFNYAAKCRKCGNIIAYTEILFPIANDSGHWIVVCDKCATENAITIQNPMESYLTKGGSISDRIDHDIVESIDASKIEEESPEGTIYIKEHPLEVTSLKFDIGNPQIYRCSNCHLGIEGILYEALKSNIQQINSQYGACIGYYLKGSCGDFEYMMAKVNFTCTCGTTGSAYFAIDFDKRGGKLPSSEAFKLCHATTQAFTESINGIYSKTDCRKILEKMIMRWNILFPRVVVVTPFVGHDYLKPTQLCSIWQWLINISVANKTKLVTRTATMNKYKKKAKDVGIDFDLLKEYELTNTVLDSFSKKQDFHAKFYCGVASDSVEIISGSFNLMEGPSFENLSFFTMSLDSFRARYESPLGISLSALPNVNRRNVLIYQENGEWNAKTMEETTKLFALQ